MAWKPFVGVEFTLDDGRKLRVRNVEFIVDDDKEYDPERWRLMIFDKSYLPQLCKLGLAEKLE